MSELHFFGIHQRSSFYAFFDPAAYELHTNANAWGEFLEFMWIYEPKSGTFVYLVWIFNKAIDQMSVHTLRSYNFCPWYPNASGLPLVTKNGDWDEFSPLVDGNCVYAERLLCVHGKERLLRHAEASDPNHSPWMEYSAQTSYIRGRTVHQAPSYARTVVAALTF